MTIASGQDAAAGDINALVSQANQLHVHDYTDYRAGYGKESTATEGIASTTDPAPKNIYVSGVGSGQDVGQNLAVQLEQSLNELFNHTHTYTDRYGTACNCNCNCNCTRGSI